MDASKQFLDMVTEIVKASQLGISVADYLNDSIFRTLSIGANHDDRVRTIGYLTQTGCLQIRDDKFIIIESSAPEWLIQGGAMGYEQAFDLASQFLPPSERKEKFDHAVLQEIGLRGELAFVEYLRNKHKSNQEIRHVSLFDDSLGYDVICETYGQPKHMYEVKTTSRPNLGIFEFFLSRNEFETSMKIPNWKIACMRISKEKVKFEGFINWENVNGFFPIDQGKDITWSSAKVTIKTIDLLTDSE
jgi:hypothetical protein